MSSRQLTRGRSASEISGLVYYNALTVNSTPYPIKAEFSSVESSPVLEVPRDYHLSVIRFFLSSRNLLPIFWWQQNQDPTLPQQQGVYTVSFSFGPTVVSERLVFRTQDLGGTPPPNTQRTIGIDNALYWGVYAHSSFIESLNAALKSAYSRISALEPTAPPVVAGCRAPFIMFAPGSSLLIVVAGRPFSEQYAGGPTMKIWMNNQLYTFFSESMQYGDRFFPGTNPLSADCDFSLWITDRGGQAAATQQFAAILNPQWLTTASYVTNQLAEYNGINYIAIAPSTGAVPPSSPGSWTAVTGEIPPDYDYATTYSLGDQVLLSGVYYVFTNVTPTANKVPGRDFDYWAIDPSLMCYNVSQDYQSVYRWLAVQRYILIGTGLSAVPEFLPPPNGGYNQTTQPFLIDFTPDYSTSADAAGTGAGNILYTPTAEYKRVELQSGSPLTYLSLSVWVMTNEGVQLPVYLGPQGSFSCKLLFERKDHGRWD